MHAATVDVLVSRGKFDPPIAVAVAEAIDMAIGNAQVVTVPVMDSRFAALGAKIDARFAKVDARFAEFEAKVDTRFAEAEAKVDARFVAFEAKMDARFAASDAKMDARFATYEAKFDSRLVAQEAKFDSRFVAQEARFDTKLAKLKTDLIFWIIAVTVGNTYLPKLVSAITDLISAAVHAFH